MTPTQAPARHSATDEAPSGVPALAEEWSAKVDRRSIEILERRRKASARRGWVVRRALVVADLLGLALAFLGAQALFGREAGGANRLDLIGESLLFLLTLPVWVAVAKLYGLYDRDEERTDHSTVDELVGVFHLVTVGAWLLFAGTRIADVIDLNLRKLAAFWLLAVILITLGRAAARALSRRRASYVQNTVIVGAGEVGERIARKLLTHPEYGLNFVGFVDAAPGDEEDGAADAALLGPPEELYAIVYLYDVERVIVAFPGHELERTLAAVRLLRDLPVQVDIVPRLFELVSPNVDIHMVEGLPLLGLRPPRLSRSARLVKRTTDLAVSSALLVLLAPAFAVIASLIKKESKGPVLFRQVRRGAEGRTFEIFKFRTMAVDADQRKSELSHLNKHVCNGGDPRMFKIPDDPRVTRVGRVLRRYSLDELPQLLNVLRGEMSLVGPRPLVLDEDEHVSDWGRRRLSVKPGITGPWQVLGRTNIPFEEMIPLDCLYVTDWSLFSDLKWLLRTVPAVLRSTDAY